jgi:sterol desaturase/sphingolipid hydroxylase (fatty acid hydroxylase superfamily)
MDVPTLPGLLFGFFLLFGVFRLLELRLPREQRTPLWRKGLLTDLSYWIFTPYVTNVAVGIVVLGPVALFAFVAYGRIEEREILAGFGPLATLPYWLQALLMLIVADFAGYWMHRLFHGRRLWRFHAVHHSSETLDWLSSVRGHPINELLGRIATTIPLLALGFAPAAALWVAPVFALFAILLHANLDWDWGRFRSVIASPRFHRWHHTTEAEARDKNFAGLFPIWDILFGTYYMPAGRRPERFGTDTPVPDGLMAQLAFPFRKPPR